MLSSLCWETVGEGFGKESQQVTFLFSHEIGNVFPPHLYAHHFCCLNVAADLAPLALALADSLISFSFRWWPWEAFPLSYF